MKNFKKICAVAAAAFFLILSQSSPVKMAFNLPEQINIYANDITQLNEDFSQMRSFGSQSQTTGKGQQSLFKYIETEEGGIGTIDLKLLGITVKKVDVIVHPEKEVLLGGQCVGVAMYTKGLLVIDRSEIAISSSEKRNPGMESGLLIGDFIEKANSTELKDIGAFNKIIEECEGKTITLSVKRGEQTLSLSITPALDYSEKKYRLGLWLRDSTAGIGTITYCNPTSREFVALGHPISDNDTGIILPVGQGAIVECRLNAIEKGQKGVPGELKGSFNTNANSYGSILDNCSYGLYGVLTQDLINPIYPQPVPIASRDMVKEGKATILATIDGDGIKEYDIEIIKTNHQSARAPKGMIIKVTDQRLLEKTGGIVQGMSGSPILQNGRLIGAVTHVLISDPTKGYGLYIDWMFND